MNVSVIKSLAKFINFGHGLKIIDIRLNICYNSACETPIGAVICCFIHMEDQEKKIKTKKSGKKEEKNEKSRCEERKRAYFIIY